MSRTNLPLSDVASENDPSALIGIIVGIIGVVLTAVSVLFAYLQWRLHLERRERQSRPDGLDRESSPRNATRAHIG